LGAILYEKSLTIYNFVLIFFTNGQKEYVYERKTYPCAARARGPVDAHDARRVGFDMQAMRNMLFKENRCKYLLEWVEIQRCG